jgi:hypothetical protein
VPSSCEGGGMAVFVAQHDTPLSSPQAWSRLTAWTEHARYVPLTSVSITTEGPNRVGTVFVARTHLGPLTFDDPMEIVQWSPPDEDGTGHCRLVKAGRVMLGWAELQVVAEGSGSRATWTEDISVSRMPGWTDAGTRMVSRLMFSRVLRRLLETDPHS